jgi:phosphatidate cytidylyltransferase
MSPLVKRILSAVVLGPPVLYASWVGSWPFLGLVALAGGLLAWEWGRLCRGRFDAGGKLLAVMAVMVGLFGAALPLPTLGLIMVAALVVPMANSNTVRPIAVKSGPWLRIGAVYIGVPLLALTWLRHHDRAIFLWLLLLVWATDVMAYAVGRMLGGPKLLPAVSPKKTWSGLAGGMLGAGAVGALAALHEGQPVGLLALLSATLAVWAQAGDLAESWVKRYFGVKDSSQIIPGHGGILDRVDGLLAAAPAAVVFCLADPQRFAHWS